MLLLCLYSVVFPSDSIIATQVVENKLKKERFTSIGLYVLA